MVKPIVVLLTMTDIYVLSPVLMANPHELGGPHIGLSWGQLFKMINVFNPNRLYLTREKRYFHAL